MATEPRILPVDELIAALRQLRKRALRAQRRAPGRKRDFGNKRKSLRRAEAAEMVAAAAEQVFARRTSATPRFARPRPPDFDGWKARLEPSAALEAGKARRTETTIVKVKKRARARLFRRKQR